MTLGEKLKQIYESQKRHENRLQEEKLSREEKYRARRRQRFQDFCDYLQVDFCDDINRGRIPQKKITEWGKKFWLKEILQGESPDNQDIWDSLLDYFNSENINIVVTEENDGVGIDHWYVITAEPTI